VPQELSYTDAVKLVVVPTNAFHDTRMCGRCSKPREEGVESGPTASPCSAGLPVHVSDGYGTVKTMSGPRCTANTKRDGYTSMLAKKLGTSRGSTQKVNPKLSILFLKLPLT
jgi:hypothetical protein